MVVTMCFLPLANLNNSRHLKLIHGGYTCDLSVIIGGFVGKVSDCDTEEGVAAVVAAVVIALVPRLQASSSAESADRVGHTVLPGVAVEEVTHKVEVGVIWSDVFHNDQVTVREAACGQSVVAIFHEFQLAKWLLT